MAKLKPKPVDNEFDAIQWRGFITFSPEKDLYPFEQEQLAGSIDYVLGFERWCKKHLKGRNFKYRGSDLIMFDQWSEVVLKPNMWIVMIPDDDTGLPMPNFMTDEQVKSFYDEMGN